MAESNKTHARWLIGELPGLQRDGVLDAATAERLRVRYDGEGAAAGGWARTLFPLLGAVLMALGVILLVAHNWDQLSRPLRVLLAFTPLLLGQLACVWTFLRARHSAAWRESSAAFTALSFAAALSLVGQIYHFPGDLDRFLLTCGLIALPLVYALNAALTAALCALAFAGWSFAVAGRDPSLFAVLGWFALLLPMIWQRMRRDPGGLATVWLLLAVVPTFFAAVLATMPNVPRLGLWWFAELGAILMMLAALSAPSGRSLWRRPLAAYGGAAVVVAALIGSFPDIWRGWFWYLRPDQLPVAWAFLTLGMALLAVLCWRAWRAGDRLAPLFALPALLMAIVASTDSRPLALVLAIALSAWVLLAGIAMIRTGLQRQDGGLATRGLALIALLVMLRFVDNEWSFTARGVAFVLTGGAFIAAHLWLRRRMAS